MTQEVKRNSRRRSSAGKATAAETTVSTTVETPIEAQIEERQPIEEATIVKAEDKALVTRPEFPPLDAPARNSSQPVRSYKPPFNLADKQSWEVSSDGGQTKESANTLVLAGIPYGLQLVISEATWKKGWTDYRLRFMFTNQEGELEELNLNAINPSRDNPDELVITGPARSLLGGLLACCDTPEVAYSFSQGVRMTLKTGARGSCFIDLDVVGLDAQGNIEWDAMSGPSNTKRIKQGPAGLVESVEKIHGMLTGLSVLQPIKAVIGEMPEAHAPEEFHTVAVDATAVVVDQDQEG